MEALELGPAEVLAGERAALREVDLLALVLADVGDRDVARPAVEREPPRVAQADREDARRAPRGVEAQDLAQQPVRVLRVAERVAAQATVTGAGVEAPVGAELKLTAVVVRVRAVLDADELPARRAIRSVDARAPELLDVDVAVVAREVDVEEPALRVVRRERHRQQSALAACEHVGAEVQERPRELASVAHDPDRPGLLHDEEPPRVAGRRRQVGRRVEAADPPEVEPGDRQASRCVVTPSAPDRREGEAGGERESETHGRGIGLGRFELPTSPTRTERATRLRHSPNAVYLSAADGFLARHGLVITDRQPGQERVEALLEWDLLLVAIAAQARLLDRDALCDHLVDQLRVLVAEV